MAKGTIEVRIMLSRHERTILNRWMIDMEMAVELLMADRPPDRQQAIRALLARMWEGRGGLIGEQGEQP